MAVNGGFILPVSLVQEGVRKVYRSLLKENILLLLSAGGSNPQPLHQIQADERNQKIMVTRRSDRSKAAPSPPQGPDGAETRRTFQAAPWRERAAAVEHIRPPQHI